MVVWCELGAESYGGIVSACSVSAFSGFRGCCRFVWRKERPWRSSRWPFSACEEWAKDSGSVMAHPSSSGLPLMGDDGMEEPYGDGGEWEPARRANGGYRLAARVLSDGRLNKGCGSPSMAGVLGAAGCAATNDVTIDTADRVDSLSTLIPEPFGFEYGSESGSALALAFAFAFGYGYGYEYSFAMMKPDTGPIRG